MGNNPHKQAYTADREQFFEIAVLDEIPNKDASHYRKGQNTFNHIQPQLVIGLFRFLHFELVIVKPTQDKRNKDEHCRTIIVSSPNAENNGNKNDCAENPPEASADAHIQDVFT